VKEFVGPDEILGVPLKVAAPAPNRIAPAEFSAPEEGVDTFALNGLVA
jgi:hypothetical protein